jgi:murein DD-endopeptidase MepM/ murein hydrolase activator NlpD
MASVSNPRGLVALLTSLALAAALGVAAFVWRQTAGPVRVALDPIPQMLGSNTPVVVDLETARGNLAAVELRLRQGERLAVVAAEDFSDSLVGHRSVRLVARAGEHGLQEGEALLEVHAWDDYWRLLGPPKGPVLTVPVHIDLSPPPLSVLAATRYPRAGGAGVTLLHAEGAELVEVVAGTHRFRGYPHGEPSANRWVVFFGLDVDHPADREVTALARDAAANESRRALPVVIREREIPAGRVDIPRAWLDTKLPELLPDWGEIASERYAEAFVELSSTQRAQAARLREELARDSAAHALWEGPFLQPRNASALSSFGVRRTYDFEGQELDTAVHQGFDLASVRRAPVLAAAAGVVAYAAPLTIYGNTVIVDHGMGLMTLYGHCSSLEVAVGERIDRGQGIARTGSTGLAMGDHLHFEVLVGGVPVSPLEWWDAGWVRSHVTEPLREAGVTLF